MGLRWHKSGILVVRRLDSTKCGRKMCLNIKTEYMMVVGNVGKHSLQALDGLHEILEMLLTINTTLQWI